MVRTRHRRNERAGADRPRLGVSACLLGEKVRYDGETKRDRFLTDTFGRSVEWVPVCPEVECGLPVPREPIRLEDDPTAPRLVTVRTRVDLTDRMLRWTRGRVRQLARENLSGHVFKSRSPSCGIRGIPVYGGKGAPRRVGVGLFARAFAECLPLLPVEDEERLYDPAVRDNFVQRVFCLKRYRDSVKSRRSRGALVSFHAAHELQLLAHSQSILKKMDGLLERAEDFRPTELLATYEELLLEALAKRATPAKNARALRRALGSLTKDLSHDERRELRQAIEAYRNGPTPLLVPLTLLKHRARACGQLCLTRQSYLDPHPIELGLRNHA